MAIYASQVSGDFTNGLQVATGYRRTYNARGDSIELSDLTCSYRRTSLTSKYQFTIVSLMSDILGTYQVKLTNDVPCGTEMPRSTKALQ